jgi:DNA-binding winged helix-turn-helix (wHTH) protein
MNGLGSADIFEFAGFRLHIQDLSLSRLEQRGRVAVRLGRRAREVLAELLEAYPAVVDRRKLLKLWPVEVASANVDIQIKNLRDVIGTNGSIIETVYSEGFRIAVPVRMITNAHSPARLSIVVLPFADLSEGATRQYFVDGIVDNLTTDLSRIEGMLVISRNTAFTYRNNPVGTKQIGRELSVRIREACPGYSCWKARLKHSNGASSASWD